MATYATTKRKYKAKLELIGGLDPFSSPLSEPVETVPPVEACDLVSYLVLQTSFLTLQQFKARISLEAYNQFISGWIKEAMVWNTTEYSKYLVKGRVCQYYEVIKIASILIKLYVGKTFTETPLSCWIIIQQTCEIYCAHYTCMAGLGEVCKHVAAVWKLLN